MWRNDSPIPPSLQALGNLPPHFVSPKISVLSKNFPILNTFTIIFFIKKKKIHFLPFQLPNLLRDELRWHQGGGRNDDKSLLSIFLFSWSYTEGAGGRTSLPRRSTTDLTISTKSIPVWRNEICTLVLILEDTFWKYVPELSRAGVQEPIFLHFSFQVSGQPYYKITI